MAATLQDWRKRNGLTQVKAASLLGVSQPYLSLLEKGARPLTSALRSRMKMARPATSKKFSDDYFRAKLSALGYPGFAHFTPARPKSSPDALLLAVLASPEADSRVVAALPWLVRRYARQMDVGWLVQQAKLRNLQNRLGFLLQVAGCDTPELSRALRELERARLLQEATLCWDSMPTATRKWMRANRSSIAEHWNVLTRVDADDVNNAA
jgi:transcriptional regulator with XRE-family HTH domain